MSDGHCHGAWLDRAQCLLQIAIDLDDPIARQDVLELATRWAARAAPARPAAGRPALDPPSASNDH